jgi:hypothetical protein
VKLSTLEAIFGILNRAGVRYLVVEGTAVNAHGYQRLTNVLDLVIDLEAPNLSRALRALGKLGYRPVLPVNPRSFADPLTRRKWIEERNLEVFSLTSDQYRDVTVDIFAAEPFDFNVEYAACMLGEVGPELDVPFVRLETLIRIKEAAARPRDLDDVEHLRMILQELGENERAGE